MRTHPRTLLLSLVLGWSVSLVAGQVVIQDQGTLAARDATVREAAIQRYNQALASAEAGDLDEAIEGYREALELDPELVDAWTNLGSVLLRAGQPEEAAKAFRAALRIEPDNLAAHLNLAAALRAARRLGEALEHVTALLRRPDLEAGIAARAWMLKGVLALQMGSYGEGAEAFEKALDGLGNKGLALMNLAVCRFHQGRYKEAREALERAIEERPGLARESLTPHLYLGRLAMEEGDARGAVEHFRQALAVRPSLRVRRHLWRALMRAGDREGAMEVWRLVAKETPADGGKADRDFLRETLSVALERAAAGDDEAADHLLLAAYERQPDLAVSQATLDQSLGRRLARALATRAQARLDQRAWREALTDLNQAYKLSGDASLLRDRARCRLALGDVAGARADFEAGGFQSDTDREALARALAGTLAQRLAREVSLPASTGDMGGGVPDDIAQGVTYAASLSPQDGQINYLRGLVEAARGHAVEAMRAFEVAARRVPSWVEAQWNAAALAWHQGAFPAVLRYLGPLIERPEGLDPAHRQEAERAYGLARLFSGAAGGAASAATAVDASNRELAAAAHARRAFDLLKLGDLEAAREQARRAAHVRAPGDAPSLLDLLFTEDVDQARKLIESAKGDETRAPPEVRAALLCNRAELAFHARRYEEARQHLGDCLEASQGTDLLARLATTDHSLETYRRRLQQRLDLLDRLLGGTAP